jgi:DNA-binding transcriptional MerR regulator
MGGATRVESTPRTRAGRSGKSASAFRTISEVAEELDVAQHVLRFWESKFPQVRPLKRGGGRRYYRPEDVELLRQIRSLLYEEGYTIKGAQKLLKSQKRPAGEAQQDVEAAADGSTASGFQEEGLAAANEEDEPARAAPSQGDAVDRRRLLAIREGLMSARDTLRRLLD